ENASESKQIGLREIIVEEVAGCNCHTIGGQIPFTNVSFRDLTCLGKVEDGGAKVGIKLAGGDREVSSTTAEINHVTEARQIKRLDNPWRTEQAKAMHTLQESFFRFLSAEKLIEDGALGAKHLLPPRSALANAIFEAVPEPEEDVVRIKDVSSKGLLAGAAEISTRDGFVLVEILVTAKKLQIHANIEQSLERLGFNSKRCGEAGMVTGNLLKKIENTECNGGKHHFRATKAFNKIKDGSGIHGVHSCLHQGHSAAEYLRSREIYSAFHEPPKIYFTPRYDVASSTL